MSTRTLVRSALDGAARLFIGSHTCALLGTEPFARCTAESRLECCNAPRPESELDRPAPSAAAKSRWVRF